MSDGRGANNRAGAPLGDGGNCRDAVRVWWRWRARGKEGLTYESRSRL